MTKTTRRVGSLTLGICLVVSGITFIGHSFFHIIPYALLFRLWPFILIMLGIEVLLSYFLNKEDEMKYDMLSFFLIIAMTLFSFLMAGLDFAVTNQMAI